MWTGTTCSTTRVLHISGITAGLSDSCHAVVAEAMRRARAAGVTVSFDVNYRAKLWSAAAAGERLGRSLPKPTCSFARAPTPPPCSAAPASRRRNSPRCRRSTRAQGIFGTYGAQGAALLQGRDFVRQPALAAQIADRIGSGDAFAAGAIDGFLDGDLRAGLRRGVALASIALSQHGDRVLTSRAELDAVLTQAGGDVAR